MYETAESSVKTEIMCAALYTDPWGELRAATGKMHHVTTEGLNDKGPKDS